MCVLKQYNHAWRAWKLEESYAARRQGGNKQELEADDFSLIYYGMVAYYKLIFLLGWVPF